MADRSIDTKHGSIEIVVDLKTARDGNTALREATAEAEAQAKAQRRKLRPGYGTRRDGDTLYIIFALQAE